MSGTLQCPGCGRWHDSMNWPVTTPARSTAYTCDVLCQSLYAALVSPEAAS